MNRLWAPWRIRYIAAKKTKGCIFCLASRPKSRDLVVFKSAHSICMLNIYPYNNGHLMVAPLRHLKDISLLTEDEAMDLFRSVIKAKKLLDKALKPEGYNIGANINRTAGAGVAGHLHIHIVPRWQGDENFMPVIAGTKVISQSLKELLTRLKDAQSKPD